MSLIAIDFETHLIDENNIFPKPVCVSSFDGGSAFLFTGQENMHSFLKKSLEEDTIIAHNAVFECGVIYWHFPDLVQLMFKALEEGRIICTLINEQLDNVTREKPKYSFSLADLVVSYFKEDISESKTEDSWRLRYSELDGIPREQWPEEAVKYAIDDSIWAFKIYDRQKKTNMHLSIRSAVYLNIMASKGMKIDLQRAQLLKNEVMAFLTPRYDFLMSKGFCRKTLKTDKVSKNVKVLKEYVENLGIELRSTKKGSVSVDGESLEFYLNQLNGQDEILTAFSELAIYEKVLSSYLNRFTGPTIYTNYSVVKTTGRTSASGSSLYPSLNIQQMPREVPNVSYDLRNCFVPREGKKILSIDYAGLELCSTAHQLYSLYKKSNMRDVLNSGDCPTDMHSKLAAVIKGISYEKFMLHKKEYKDTRQLAKPINLGFPGGIGYDTMRHLLWQSGIKTYFEVLHKAPKNSDLKFYYFKLREELPDLRISRISKTEWALVRDELVKLKRDFFDLYPELETFLKETHKRFITKNVKWVKNEYDEWEEEPMYKYDVHGFKRDWCTYTAFCNGYLMQTPSAVGAKRAVSKIVNVFHDHKDITPLAFIHDEILFEISESRMDLIDEAANIMIEEMQSVLNSVRITVEASLSDYWQKADGFWTKQYFKNALNTA